MNRETDLAVTSEVVVYTPEDLQEISSSDVPAGVARAFDFEARQFIDTNDDMYKTHFDRLMALEHIDGQVTYFAQHDKVYLANGQAERLIYLVDTNTESKIVGSGEVRFALTNREPYFLNKPFVGNTLTNKEHLRQGLGRRRLLAMNAASLLVHNLVLHSDTLRRPEASAVWRSLVRLGLAESYFEPSDSPDRPANTRFKFIDREP